jgi:hypothetical protein
MEVNEPLVEKINGKVGPEFRRITQEDGFIQIESPRILMRRSTVESFTVTSRPLLPSDACSGPNNALLSSYYYQILELDSATQKYLFLGGIS